MLFSKLLLALCSTASALHARGIPHKRATSELGTFYAYGTNMSGVPIFYGDGLAYIGTGHPANITEATNVTCKYRYHQTQVKGSWLLLVIVISEICRAGRTSVYQAGHGNIIAAMERRWPPLPTKPGLDKLLYCLQHLQLVKLAAPPATTMPSNLACKLLDQVR